MATSLTGDYRLSLVSDWEDESGRVVSGNLSLQPTDSLHQFYERSFTGQWRRTGNRPAWGWTDLHSRDVTIPWTADPAARDPDHPGVVLHSNGAVELGVWRGFDGSSTTLTIRTRARKAFAGTWHSDVGFVTLEKDGRPIANPHGHFCAVRQ